MQKQLLFDTKMKTALSMSSKSVKQHAPPPPAPPPRNLRYRSRTRLVRGIYRASDWLIACLGIV